MQNNVSYSKFENTFQTVMNIETLNYLRIIDGSIIYNTHYTKDDMYDKVLYINDFFFKCKQFGIENGFQMISGLMDNQSYRNSDELAYCKVLYEDSEFNKCDMYFMAETEQVAVIDATHYVIKKLNPLSTRL